MSRFTHPLATLLVLAVLGWAQVGGIVRGYLCDCGGTIEITQRDHCHRPHSGDHPDEHHHTPPCHPHDDSGSHQHAAIIESLQARPHEGDLLFNTPPVSVGIAGLAWIHARLPTSRAASVEKISLRRTPPGSPGGLDRWPRRLTETIALRL